LRAARTSKLVSSMAILGLIVVSTLIVLVLNSSILANPMLPVQSGTPNASPRPGTLTVRLLSNQNQSNRFTSSSPIPKQFPVRDKSMLVYNATNSSNPFSQVLVTDSHGRVSQQLSPGPYVVNLKDETLDINITVMISAGNETSLVVTIYGTAHPLAFSEESGVSPTAGSARSNMYVELGASAPVANVTEPVVLEVHGTAPGSGYLVNATVISSQPPAQGTQWLELGAAETIDLVNATSIVLTTWTYSGYSTVHPMVEPIGSFVPVPAND
jgi:hypothetical protein